MSEQQEQFQEQIQEQPIDWIQEWQAQNGTQPVQPIQPIQQEPFRNMNRKWLSFLNDLARTTSVYGKM